MVTTEEGARPGADDAPAPVAPPGGPTGRGPALVVLGLAVLIVVGGGLASALATGNTPTYTLTQVRLPDGTSVPLAPATTALHAIASLGQPPADIIGKLGVPADSRVQHVTNSDRNTAQFDRTVALTTGLSATEVSDTFRLALPRLGWQVLYVGGAPQGAPGAAEVLAKQGSGDGYYWEVGVVISPTTTAGVTPYTVELFELPDGTN